MESPVGSQIPMQYGVIRIEWIVGLWATWQTWEDHLNFKKSRVKGVITCNQWQTLKYLRIIVVNIFEFIIVSWPFSHTVEGYSYFEFPCSIKFEWTYDIADPRDIEYELNDLEKVHYDFGYWVRRGYNLKDDVVVECTGKYDKKQICPTKNFMSKMP